MRSLGLCLGAWLCLTANAYGGAGIVTENVTPLGTDLVGTPVTLGGSLVLEYEGMEGVLRDYADPAAPAWVSSLSFNMSDFDRVIYGDGWLLGLHSPTEPGATLIDLHEPTLPSVVTASFAPYHFTSAHLLPGAAYLMSDALFVAYDLGTPTQPVFSTISLLAPRTAYRWPTAAGNVLYIVETTDRLRAFDTEVPTIPVDLGQVILPALRIEAMAVAGGHLQVVQAASAGLELATYDLSEPLAPVLTSSSPLAVAAQENGTSLVAADDILYVGGDAGGLQAFSLADPAHPEAGYALPDTVQQLGLAEVGLFVRASRTIRVFSRGPHDETPTLLQEHTELPWLTGVVTNGRTSVANLHQSSGVEIIDITNPTVVAGVARFDPDGKGGMARLDRNRLAYFGPTAFRLLDLGDPANPALLSMTPYPHPDLDAIDACLHNELLAVSFDGIDDGLHFYSVADPAHPVHVGAIRGSYWHLAFDGTLMAAVDGDYDEVEVFDISDFARPVSLGYLPIGEPRAVAVAKGHVLVIQPEGLSIFTVNGPDDFTLFGEIALPHTRDLVVEGSHAVASSYGGGEVVDISSLAAPTVVGWFSLEDGIQSLAAANGIIHLCTSRGTIVLRDDTWAPTSVPTAAPLANRLAAPSPNPFNPATKVSFEVAAAEPVRLTVHDLAGRLVAELASGTYAPGRHTVTWRGGDRDGRPAASGVYVFRLAGHDGATCRRATLVR
jgi:hypothetical protein